MQAGSISGYQSWLSRELLLRYHLLRRTEIHQPVQATVQSAQPQQRHPGVSRQSFELDQKAVYKEDNVLGKYSSNTQKFLVRFSGFCKSVQYLQGICV